MVTTKLKSHSLLSISYENSASQAVILNMSFTLHNVSTIVEFTLLKNIIPLKYSSSKVFIHIYSGWLRYNFSLCPLSPWEEDKDSIRVKDRMIELKRAGRYHLFPPFAHQQPTHPSETTPSVRTTTHQSVIAIGCIFRDAQGRLYGHGSL